MTLPIADSTIAPWTFPEGVLWSAAIENSDAHVLDPQIEAPKDWREERGAGAAPPFRSLFNAGCSPAERPAC